MPSAGYVAWQQLCQDVNGTGTIDDAYAAISELQNQYYDVSQQARQLISQLSEAWQGTAGDAAVAGSAPLSQAVADVMNCFEPHANVMSDQSASFQTAALQMTPIGPDAPSNNFLNEITPWHTDLDQQIADYNSNDALNQQILAGYQDGTSYNIGSLPQNYQQIAGDTAPNVQVIAPAVTAGSSGAWARAVSRVRSAGSSGAGRPFVSSGGAGGGGPVSAGGPSLTGGTTPLNPAGTTPGNTSVQDYQSVPGVGAPGSGGWGPAGGIGTGGDVAGVGPVGAFGLVEGQPYAGVGFGGRGGAGVGRGSFGASGSSGVVEEGESAAGRVGGGREVPGGMASGAGRRKRDEDGERKTAAFLVNEDNGNAIVGPLDPCVPPVIS